MSFWKEIKYSWKKINEFLERDQVLFGKRCGTLCRETRFSDIAIRLLNPLVCGKARAKAASYSAAMGWLWGAALYDTVRPIHASAAFLRHHRSAIS
jgi:hypothetical protein